MNIELTQKLKDLHSKATGALINRIALLELLEKAQTDADKRFINCRLEIATARYLKITEQICQLQGFDSISIL